MWLREQGHVFDWGTMKWCQAYTSPPNGCYDAETIALDEFGHVEGLNHHVNYADDHDYLDAVVQTFSRVKPQTGYNARAFGRCDVATLQVQYDVPSTAAKYSDLPCSDDRPDARSVPERQRHHAQRPSIGGAISTRTVRLGGNPVSARVVTLQRRPSGSTTLEHGRDDDRRRFGDVYASDTRSSATPNSGPSSTRRPARDSRGDTSGTVSMTAFVCAATTTERRRLCRANDRGCPGHRRPSIVRG